MLHFSHRAIFLSCEDCNRCLILVTRNALITSGANFAALHGQSLHFLDVPVVILALILEVIRIDSATLPALCLTAILRMLFKGLQDGSGFFGILCVGLPRLIKFMLSS